MEQDSQKDTRAFEQKVGGEWPGLTGARRSSYSLCVDQAHFYLNFLLVLVYVLAVSPALISYSSPW